MNYYTQDICCFCLSISDEKCSNKSSEYPDNLTPLDEIKTVFSELASVMESDDRICKKCNDTVGFIYEFHKTCLTNINIFSSYKKILKENLGKKQCGLHVDLNEWQKFKENILNPKQIKVESQESLLSNDDMLLDGNFVAESHLSGPAEIKKEIDINYETRNQESETFRPNSEIKIEHEESDLESEWMNETNETLDVESLKSNAKDFENTSVQSTAEMVDKEEEENQELIEDPLQEVAEEKVDEGRGHFEFIDINHSVSLEENIVDSDSHIPLIHSKRKTHKGKEPPICDICGKIFSCNAHLKKHSVSHTGEKHHKCDICGKLFSQKGNLETHMLIHTGEKAAYKCDVCGKLFNLKCYLKRHSLIHSGEKPYKCEICEKFFTYKANLKTHMLIHSGEKIHKCDVCEKSFYRKTHLNEHMLIHTDEKPNKCDVCGKSFRQMINLRRHKLIHTGEKPHQCDICGKFFTEKGKLKQHMPTHTGEKPHICDICQKPFSRKENLKRHYVSHTVEKPNKCSGVARAEPGGRSAPGITQSRVIPDLIGWNID